MCAGERELERRGKALDGAKKYYKGKNGVYSEVLWSRSTGHDVGLRKHGKKRRTGL